MFNPAFMTMAGWATPAYKQPWTYCEPYTSINRKYLKLRERLLPYFYSYAAEALPLFVKAGAMVPMWKSGINSAVEQGFGDRLTVDVYPQGNSCW